VLPKICYLGDDFLTGAAIYLAGIMTHAGLEFDYVPSVESPGDWFTADRYALYVLSDYPAARLSPEQLAYLAGAVRAGSGLAMFGGWESFHGRLGEYHRSPLVDVLPVTMREEDDRRNCAQPCLVEKVAEHPILEGIPFETPPGIGGFNAFSPKPDATILLTAVEFAVRQSHDQFQFTPKRRSPLLVVGQHGQGRTAALACDVAPHWVGGMVDWGDGRVLVDVAGGFIDVGNWYARFFANLVTWTGQLTRK
jgi:uncharacterized membrane protein